MLKKKHKCTNTFLIDLLKFLKALKVSNVPFSWYRVKKLVNQTEEKENSQERIKSTFYYCPECEQQSSLPNKCTNSHCSNSKDQLILPHSLLVMNVQQQIEQILLSIDQSDLSLSTTAASRSLESMTDIIHGKVYATVIRSIQHENQNSFVTLTCNIDGVAVYTSSEQTMWTFTACINELRRSIRYSIENIIGRANVSNIHRFFFSLSVLAVSVGRKKPSKSIMQKMLVPIVAQLKQLEKPHLYRVSMVTFQMIRVYLIAVSNDKPANSLVQNQSEPNALYGCSKCEIAGDYQESFVNFSKYAFTFASYFRCHYPGQNQCNTNSIKTGGKDNMGEGFPHFERNESRTRDAFGISMARDQSRSSEQACVSD